MSYIRLFLKRYGERMKIQGDYSLAKKLKMVILTICAGVFLLFVIVLTILVLQDFLYEEDQNRESSLTGLHEDFGNGKYKDKNPLARP